MMRVNIFENFQTVTDRDDYKMYRVACTECSDPDHHMTFSIDAIDWNEVSLCIDTVFTTDKIFHGKNQREIWLNKLLYKIKSTWQLWKHGSITMSATVSMNMDSCSKLVSQLDHAGKQVKIMYYSSLDNDE